MSISFFSEPKNGMQNKTEKRIAPEINALAATPVPTTAIQALCFSTFTSASVGNFTNVITTGPVFFHIQI